MITKKIAEQTTDEDLTELQKKLGDNVKVIQLKAENKEDALKQIKAMLEDLEKENDENSDL